MADCQALLAAGRYDAVMYLSGYVREAALKACICDTLGWTGFEESGNRASWFRPLFVHNLNMLLLYSGREAYVLSQLSTEWNNVREWNPSLRYAAGGAIGRSAAEQPLSEVEIIRRAL